MIERIMDIVASELGLDPVQVRLKNMPESTEFPFNTATGLAYDSGNYQAALAKAQDLAEWPKLLQERDTARKAGRLFGIGLSTYVEIYRLGPSKIMAAGGREWGCVRIEISGKVTVITGATPHGQGQETSFAQIAADWLGIRLKTSLFSVGDTATAHFGRDTYGSRASIAVLVLRYTHPQDREYRVPLNPVIFGREVPIGLGLITLVLLSIAIVNLFTKPEATIAGLTFSILLFTVFEISEKRMHRRQAGAAHVELDQFNLAPEGELTPANVGVRPGNILVPVSNYYALYHLEAALRRVRSQDADIVVLHVRLLRRAASGEYDLAPDQLFSTIEQLLFTKVLAIAEKEGKSVRLAVAAANNLWEGILRAAENLESSTVVVGSSSKMSVTEQAR